MFKLGEIYVHCSDICVFAVGALKLVLLYINSNLSHRCITNMYRTIYLHMSYAVGTPHKLVTII